MPIVPWTIVFLSTLAQSDADERVRPQNVKLPGTVAEIRVAKNGDLLAIRLKDSKTLALVSVLQRKLVKTLSFPGTDYVYATGGDRLLVYDRGTSVLQTFDLETFERVKAKKSPIPGVLCAMQMGSNNSSFALLRVAESTDALARVWYEVLSLEKFQSEKVDREPRNGSYRDMEEMRLSPDGTVFTAWATSHSPSGQIVGRLNGTSLNYSYEHDSVGHVLPLDSRGLAVTGTGRILGANGNTLKTLEGQALFPDQAGLFYLGVAAEKVNVFTSSDHQLVTSFSIKVKVPEFEWYRANDWKIFCDSRNEVFVVPGESGQELVFHAFNPVEELKRSGLDHLLVLSSPPRTAVVGSTFTYKLRVVTNGSNVVVEIMEGPKGAKVSGQNITWPVPKEGKGKTVSFLLHIKNERGDETFQSFEVVVDGEL